MKVIAYCIFSSWKLHISFLSLWNMILFMELSCVLVFVYGTCRLQIFAGESCCMWSIPVRETFILIFSPRETDFSHGTCCVLIFVLESFCMVIFLFVKLVHWFVSSWNWCCSRNLFPADFYSRDLCAYFCS